MKKAAFHIDLQLLPEKVAEICGGPIGARLDDRHVKLLSKMLKGTPICSFLLSLEQFGKGQFFRSLRAMSLWEETSVLHIWNIA